jgi:hypothetical protein
MKIIGLRIEKYIDKEISGHNCNFKYKDAEFEKHIICGVLEDNRKVEIELSRSEGECGSGWTTASWGNVKVTEVKKFNGYTFIPKEILTIEDIEPDFDGDISNNVFSVDYVGGDNYYPSGGYNVNMELFKETIRNKNLRPVWIFKGKSNSGKSFLASKLNELDVYETDSNEVLPESIVASVIVLGNKYDFNLEDVKSKIFGEAEIQVVDFV